MESRDGALRIAREAQRRLLEKAKEEYESTAGPSTQGSGISSAAEEKLMAPSSRTSTSSDAKSNVSKR